MFKLYTIPSTCENTGGAQQGHLKFVELFSVKSPAFPDLRVAELIIHYLENGSDK